jgi:hypothetical protein
MTDLQDKERDFFSAREPADNIECVLRLVVAVLATVAIGSFLYSLANHLGV